MPVTVDDSRLKRPDGPGEMRRIGVGVAELRSAPDGAKSVLTLALFGEAVEVFGVSGDFVQVRCQRDGYVGWTERAHLVDAATAITHRICALRSFAYDTPDLKSRVLETLSLGSRVAVTETDGNYLKCEGAGWVHDRHLEAVDAPFASDPASIAERYLHVPYLWGARSSIGIDCSGLMQQAFEAAGVMIPRDSDMQYQWGGEAIDDWHAPGAMQRGDMVFWKGHVGMMLDAGTLIHANAWHMAVAAEPLELAIERIKNKYAEPIGARRIDVSAMTGQTPDWIV